MVVQVYFRKYRAGLKKMFSWPDLEGRGSTLAKQFARFGQNGLCVLGGISESGQENIFLNPAQYCPIHIWITQNPFFYSNDFRPTEIRCRK